MFGKLTEGGDFTAKDVQQRKLLLVIQLKHVIPRDRRRVAFAIVKQWANAGETGNHVSGGQLHFEVAVNRINQILLLAVVRLDGVGIAFPRNIRGADKRFIAFVRVDKNHALVVVLHQVGLLTLPEFWHDQV